MKHLKELRHKYRGRPIAILGAGPSLPGDLERLPADTVLIGLNHHAVKIVDVDYLVFADKPDRNPDLAAAVAAHMGKRITNIKGASDWDVAGTGYWQGGMSGTMATWFACYMGGDPVLLCGMDCNQPGPRYFYSGPDDMITTPEFPLEDVQAAWRKALDRCPDSHRIRSVSGPLVEVFGGL